MRTVSHTPNRASRRNGNKPPPPSKGPRASFLLVVAAVLAIAGVWGVVFLNRTLQTPSATATPTPGPNAATAGIPLVDGALVGTSLFAAGDTASGGRGQAVDGIPCFPEEGMGVHVHAHLTVFAQGKQIAVPSQVGIVQPSQGQPCLYWLHTHDASGIVHLESQLDAGFTLGQFFDIWGEPLSPTRVASFGGPVHAYVNGAAYRGDLRAIPISAHQQITLEIGSPLVAPPRYVFPAQE